MVLSMIMSTPVPLEHTVTTQVYKRSLTVSCVLADIIVIYKPRRIIQRSVLQGKCSCLILCLTGRYSNYTGLQMESDCLLCPGGYYCDLQAQTDYSKIVLQGRCLRTM